MTVWWRPWDPKRTSASFRDKKQRPGTCKPLEFSLSPSLRALGKYLSVSSSALLALSSPSSRLPSPAVTFGLDSQEVPGESSALAYSATPVQGLAAQPELAGGSTWNLSPQPSASPQRPPLTCARSVHSCVLGTTGGAHVRPCHGQSAVSSPCSLRVCERAREVKE